MMEFMKALVMLDERPVIFIGVGIRNSDRKSMQFNSSVLEKDGFISGRLLSAGLQAITARLNSGGAWCDGIIPEGGGGYESLESLARDRARGHTRALPK